LKRRTNAVIKSISYRDREILYRHIVNPGLRHTYLAVDFDDGVILKSPPIPEEDVRTLLLTKAAWIMDKLKLVAREPMGDIVSGSRIPYLGKRYYTLVIEDSLVPRAKISFNNSSFKIYVKPTLRKRQNAIDDALEQFYREKAIEKITPRFLHWSQLLNLKPAACVFKKLSKSWGSCSNNNQITINTHAVKLPYSLIDYIVVHKLCHILHKPHTTEFWDTVATYLPGYKELDDRLTMF
jgi:predicted metal-dependent hydrolase